VKRTPFAIAAIAVLAALVAVVWLRSSKAPAEDTSVEPEVAVHIAKITRTTLRAYVTAYGVAEPAPPGEHPAAGARVAPTVSGVVTAVRCAEGQHVDKGAALFQLDSRAADVAADRAREAVEFATKNLERQKRLIQVEATSQKLVLDAEQAFASARNELFPRRGAHRIHPVLPPIAARVLHHAHRPHQQQRTDLRGDRLRQAHHRAALACRAKRAWTHPPNDGGETPAAIVSPSTSRP
jgi:multidrug efflux pump subunit AcrA (membrane-fusion protein)